MEELRKIKPDVSPFQKHRELSGGVRQIIADTLASDLIVNVKGASLSLPFRGGVFYFVFSLLSCIGQ
jgi:hypothetical protein